MFAELLSPAVRTALRRPGFSLVVVTLVALSAGLATTAANRVYQTLLPPLPYAQADRLCVLSSTNPPEGWYEAPGSVTEFVATYVEHNFFSLLGVAVAGTP